MVKKDYNKTLDIVKLIATILIVGSHSLPLFSNQVLNFYYGQWFFRFCVPLFFLASGYFFSNMDKNHKKEYIERIFIIYLISAIIYIPLEIYNHESISHILYFLLFGYGHLWYLSALFIGLVLLYYFDNGKKKVYYLIIPLMLIGILFGEYYKLLNLNVLNQIHDFLYYLGTARNSLFFAFPILLIGSWIRTKKEILLKKKNVLYICLLIASAIISFIECFLLNKSLRNGIYLDMTIFNIFFPIILFILCLKIKNNIKESRAKNIRKLCDYVYIVHLYIVYYVRFGLKVELFKGFILVLVISFIISWILFLIIKRIKTYSNA